MTARFRRPGLVLAALTVLALASLSLVQAGSSRPAAAAEIPGAITDVSVREASSEYYSNVHVDVAWTVPDDVTAGDSFSLTLPPQLVPLTRGFDLLAPDGSVVATASVSGGVVTFTLTSYVDSHTAVSGTAFMEMSWELTEIDPGSTNTVVFEASSEVFTDTVDIGPIDVVDPTVGRKQGYWTDSVDQGTTTPEGALGWVLEAPVGPWDTVVFVDQVSEGHEVDCDTVQVRSGTEFDARGELTDTTPLDPSRFVVACTTEGLTVTVTSVAAQERVQVRYATDITMPDLESYSNEATITADGQTQPVRALVVRSDAGGTGGGTATTTTSTTEPTTTSTTEPTTTTDPGTTTTGGPTTSVTVPPSAERPPPTTPKPHSPGLPRTGAESRATTALGVTLLVGGLLLVLAARRRRLADG